MGNKLVALAVAFVTIVFAPYGIAAGPDHVDITWMSIANIHYQMGSFGVLTDGYITRIPESEFHGGGGGDASHNKPRKPGVAPGGRGVQGIGSAEQHKAPPTG